MDRDFRPVHGDAPTARSRQDLVEGQDLRSPTLDSLDRTLHRGLAGSPHRLDRTLVELNTNLDELARLSGLKLAA
jgi:hypothetical protein